MCTNGRVPAAGFRINVNPFFPPAQALSLVIQQDVAGVRKHILAALVWQRALFLAYVYAMHLSSCAIGCFSARMGQFLGLAAIVG
jgi:hypothetical protein